jgi:SNF2 family DNA or RNA helicase
MERSTMDTARVELLKKKAESTQPAKDMQSHFVVEDLEIPRPIYCAEILGGFRASAKLDSIVDDFKNKVPQDEKLLIASFFKGSLDLLEAIFHELKVEVARFDGDIGSEEREAQLQRFKTRPTCRVLLMTVQTGGTGLNLVCANHVWFVDRFWNPMVM